MLGSLETILLLVLIPGCPSAGHTHELNLPERKKNEKAIVPITDFTSTRILRNT